MTQPEAKVLLITGEGGLGDRSFNDAGFAGVRRALKELGVGIDLVELNEIGDLTEDTYTSAAAMKKYTLIIGLGFYQDKILNSTARKFPDQNFMLIDAASTEPNVKGVLFREEENAFLAGILAAHVTQQPSLKGINKDKTIGIILGMDAPHLTRYAFSYEAGAKTVANDVNVLVDIVGNFLDRDRGKQIALSQINKGADIIYQVAGGAGLGILDAVGKKEIYAIGEGLNQNHLHPKFIVASTYKHMDLAVFEAIKSAMKGEFVGGNYSYGFKEGSLEVSLEGSEVSLSDEAKRALLTYKQRLIEGRTKAPLTRANLHEYLKILG
ncbi:MAG: hypothetical protein A3C55_02055 [Gammaproteobacteria bacterium RIFCSPHIGHO2_02_FULL_42_13]|nr:MAG: hypothetical protein A3C55_02055 [Gammaproteobacteria bacterium RIFCSPHIGHO2_02_FULL_42_13]OGT71158.1 MAG: hypothetical protein A3H43_01760 [Gammaproteobacteria bacterium RIFCSPLOWO2_02_FULL_42_9]